MTAILVNDNPRTLLSIHFQQCYWNIVLKIFSTTYLFKIMTAYPELKHRYRQSVVTRSLESTDAFYVSPILCYTRQVVPSWGNDILDICCMILLISIFNISYIHKCIHTYTHTHTYIHTYIHTHIHTYIHACMHACMHTCIHTYIHTFIHTYIHTYTHTYIHTCLFLLISMLWHRQAIFESKGDKLSSSAECRIRTQGLRHLFASRLNACWQTDWAIEDQAKNLNSTARPYDQQAFSPYIHTYIQICLYKFDALAQGNAYKPTK